MRNLAPSRSLTRRANQRKMIAFFIGAIGFFVLAIGLLLLLIPFAAPGSPSYTTYQLIDTLIILAGIALIVIAIVIAVRAFNYRKDNDLALATGNFLTQFLDDRFTFIRNINSRETGYIDAVLVGPPGVLVFYILDVTGAWANEGSDWLKQDSAGQWLPAHVNPTFEAVADIRRMREYLTKRELSEVPVYGLIVFLTEPPALSVVAKNPVVPLTRLPSVVDTLRDNYFAKDRIDAGRVNAIVDMLYSG